MAKRKSAIERMTEEIRREHENSHIGRMLKMWEEERQRLEEIMRKEHPTLDEMIYVLLQKAFGMQNKSSMYDGQRQVLGFYLNNVSQRTIQRHYRKFTKGELDSEGIKRLERLAKRVYDQHCREILEDWEKDYSSLSSLN